MEFVRWYFFWYTCRRKYYSVFFQIYSFTKRHNNQMTAVFLQVILIFYTNYSKNNLIISANTWEKYVVSKEYRSAHDNDKMRFLPNCRYHIILLGDIEEMLEKLDAFRISFRHVDCLYFSCIDPVKNCCREWTTLWKRAQGSSFRSTKQKSGQDAQHPEKKLLRKKYRKHLLSCFHKTKPTQTSRLVYADRIEKV